MITQSLPPAPDVPLPLLPTLGLLRQASYSPSLSKTWWPPHLIFDLLTCPPLAWVFSSLAYPRPGCFLQLPTPGWQSLPHLLAPDVCLTFLPTPGWLRQGTPGANPTSVCVWLRVWLDANRLQTSFFKVRLVTSVILHIFRNIFKTQLKQYKHIHTYMCMMYLCDMFQHHC